MVAVIIPNINLECAQVLLCSMIYWSVVAHVSCFLSFSCCLACRVPTNIRDRQPCRHSVALYLDVAIDVTSCLFVFVAPDFRRSPASFFRDSMAIVFFAFHSSLVFRRRGFHMVALRFVVLC